MVDYNNNWVHSEKYDNRKAALKALEKAKKLEAEKLKAKQKEKN